MALIFAAGLRVSCSFTYTKYDLTTLTLPCNKSFTLMDCDEPCISVVQSDTCDPTACANKDLPVMYEACNTSVVTATATQTLFKPRASTCCQACSVTTACKPLLTLPSVSNGVALSRCERLVPTTTASRGLVANVTAFAVQLFTSARDLASVLGAVVPGILVVGASALVLLVYGLAAANKVQQQKHQE